MAGPLDKLSETGRDVIVSAEEQARALMHGYIGQEHLLLALTLRADGAAAEALAVRGVTADAVRADIQSVVGLGEKSVGEIGVTPRVKKAIELAAQHARRLERERIEPEHILLGMLSEGSGMGVGILDHLGVSAQVMQDAVRDRLKARAASDDARARLDDVFSHPIEREPTVKRYTLVLPESLFQQVQDLADREQTTVVEVMRRFTKLGLLATRIQDSPDGAVIVREHGREREIVIL